MADFLGLLASKVNLSIEEIVALAGSNAALLVRTGAVHGLTSWEVSRLEMEVERALVLGVLTQLAVQSVLRLLEHVDFFGSARDQTLLEFSEALEWRAALDALLLFVLHGSHLAIRLGRVREAVHATQQLALCQLLVADVGHLHLGTLVRRDVADLVELGLVVVCFSFVQA